MRGDAHSNTDGGHLQQDSSSGSSSPHSNTSNDDEILEVSPPGFARIHNIYNFSIPDVIKHEPRVERHENNERVERSSSVRKRTCPMRQVDEQLNNQENDVPVPLAHKKKRRRITAAENLIDDDDDADCHRHPVIDLTNIDSHDDFSNAHSDSEVHDSSHIETRPLHHTTPRPSFNEVLSNMQRFSQQLEDSQERMLRFNRLQRLRRRRNSRAIVSDGPLVTDDMLLQSPEADIVSTPEMTSADDSVMVINEVRGDGTIYMDDHDIALRMASDPTYSPPYASNPSSEHYRTHRYSRTDESFHQFQERIRCIRQRSRDRLDQVRRMSQQAQERLARLQDSLRHGRRLENIDDPPDGNNSDNENIEVFEEAENDEENNDDVEIIRESNPRIAAARNYLEPPLLDLAPPLPIPMALYLDTQDHQVRSPHTMRQALPLPDFLRTSLMHTLAPPRLHHLHDMPGYEDLWNLAERLGPAKPRGLNKQEIDQIPSFRFSATTARETNRKCVVCMGEYNNREKLRRLPCTHDFHSKCIDKWLRSNKTCPVCRDEVKIEPPNKPYTP